MELTSDKIALIEPSALAAILGNRKSTETVSAPSRKRSFSLEESEFAFGVGDLADNATPCCLARRFAVGLGP